ncbi:MAG TPA: hypothetical protein PLE25_03035 [Spirochaetales bacterium]|nr:hypothetical protein [Spirochaetales bacterium]
MGYVELGYCILVLAVALDCAIARAAPYTSAPLAARRPLPFTRFDIGMLAAFAAFLCFIVTDSLDWRLDAAAVAMFALWSVSFAASTRRRSRAGADETRGAAIGRRVAGSAGALAAIFSLAAVSVFPIRDLEPPTGPHAVGTASFVVVDGSRTGVYLDAPGTPRRVMAQAWYPAAPGAEDYPRARWIPDEALERAYAAYAGLPALTMSHLSRIRANGRVEAPALGGSPAEDGSFPVVILSHGWTGSRTMHADLAEELASRGIVAIAVDHPYGALAVAFPDGEVKNLYRGALPSRSDGVEAFDRASTFLEETYAADIAAVVGVVRGGRAVPGLEGRLDGGRIALVGHSTGGGAALLAAMIAETAAESAAESAATATESGVVGFLGVVGLDAWVEPIAARLDEGLATPQLHVGSASWAGGRNAELLGRLRAASGEWSETRIPGSGHADFAMLRYVTSAGSVTGLAGERDGFAFAADVTPLVCDWLGARLSR